MWGGSRSQDPDTIHKFSEVRVRVGFFGYCRDIEVWSMMQILTGEEHYKPISVILFSVMNVEDSVNEKSESVLYELLSERSKYHIQG